MIRTLVTLTVAASLLGACASDPAPGDGATNGAATPPDFEPPVATNPDPPVRYPLALFEQKTEGTVVLRLFIDEAGTILPESTQVAEGSGHAALDAAALAAVAEMRFAPARRSGVPVATAFLQPIHFRHPEGSEAGGTS